MAKFVLVLMLLTPAGTFRQHKVLSRPMPYSRCVEAAEHPALSASYLVDYWAGRGASGNPALLCVELETRGDSGGAARPE